MWWLKSKAILGALLVAAAGVAQLIGVASDVVHQVSSVAHAPEVAAAVAAIGGALAAIGLRHKQEKLTPPAK